MRKHTIKVMMFDFDKVLSSGPANGYLPINELKEKFKLSQEQIQTLIRLESYMLEQYYLPQVSMSINTIAKERMLHKKVYELYAEKLKLTKNAEEFITYMTHRRMHDMDYELYSETETVLKQMKALFRLAVLTNALPSRLPEISRTGVGFLFDGIFISNIVGMHKPQKEFYEYALKQLRVQAEEVVYVDDVEAHLHPAAALGMHVLLMDRENKMSSQWFTIVRDLYEVQTFAFNL